MAYDFNGISNLSTTSTPVTGVPMTFACFFNSDTVGGSNPVNSGVLMYAGVPSATSRYLLSLFQSKIYATAINASNTVSSALSTSSFSIGTWTHACGVFESTTSRKVYFNGTLEDTKTNLISPANATQLRIGIQRLNNTNVSGHDGRIAEAGIWNVALTDAEILSLSRGMTCDKIRPQSLVYYTPLIRDIQDLARGMTLTNTNSTVANHPRVYA